MAEVTTIDVPGFPQDVLDAASLAEGEIMNADITDLDTQYIIAKAIMAERNRCADLAKHYALACINAGYSEEASGAGYYACSQVEGEIRNPEKYEAESSVDIDEDDLPF